jgi:hypothetical protein
LGIIGERFRSKKRKAIENLVAFFVGKIFLIDDFHPGTGAKSLTISINSV